MLDYHNICFFKLQFIYTGIDTIWPVASFRCTPVILYKNDYINVSPWSRIAMTVVLAVIYYDTRTYTCLGWMNIHVGQNNNKGIEKNNNDT